MDRWHHVFAIQQQCRRCGKRSAVCSTARFSLTLIRSPSRMRCIQPADPPRAPDQSAAPACAR
jgi:hypothetical protein